MKRILTAVFAILMIAAMTVSAFASSDAFVSSPSQKRAPELVDYENESEDCVAELEICAYGDRDQLEDEDRLKLEEAYSNLLETADLGDLNDDIDSLASSLKVDSNVFAISDVFDISYYDCDGHEAHGEFTITIKPESVKNYAGMIHYTDDGWELLESEEKDGNITFVVDSLSPFAIMVHDGTASGPAWSLDPDMGIAISIGVGIMALLLLAIAFRKKEI